MLTALAGINEKVAAIAAPLYQDLNRKNKQPGFFRKSLFDVHYFSPIEGLHEIFQAISSGIMINLRYLPEIGLMNESLFIDWLTLVMPLIAKPRLEYLSKGLLGIGHGLRGKMGKYE